MLLQSDTPIFNKLFMSVIQRGTYLCNNLKHSLRRQRSLTIDNFAQRLPFDVFHNDIVASFRFGHFECRNDISMF
jgi:hypothetical protein